MAQDLDALILGFYEPNFAALAKDQKAYADTSGSYHELSTNSLLNNGSRMTYIDTLDALGAEARGGPVNLNPFEQPSLGVAYLASYLARRGFSVEIVNFINSGISRLTSLLNDNPSVVVITSTYYVTEEPIREIVKFVRSVTEQSIIVVGGPRINNLCNGSSNSRRNAALDAMGADIYVNDSQGEDSLARLLALIKEGERDFSSVPNLLIPTDDGYEETERLVETNDMATNVIQWDLFNSEYVMPTAYMRTARSCPFSCLFCDYPSSAGKHTVSDVTHVINEITYLVEHGVENIIFIDDTFNVPLPRFRELLKQIIARQLKFNWVSFFRCSNADEEAFDLMKESGCLGVYLGIESGDDRILTNMNKYTTLDKYEAGIHELNRRGILTLASMIVGYPGETIASVDNTIDFLSRTPLDFFSVQLYYHNPMAPIENLREHYRIEGSHYSWKHSTMDWLTAAAEKERMITSVNGPSLLPLYDLSIWAFPYLISKGLDVPLLKSFLAEMHSHLVAGFGDSAKGDIRPHLSSLASRYGKYITPSRPDVGRVL